MPDPGDFAYHPPSINDNMMTPDQYSARLDRAFGKLKDDYARRRAARVKPTNPTQEEPD